MQLSSPDFNDGGYIPTVFTAEGDGRSPALVWTGLPAQTRSLVLWMYDPDVPAPMGPFTHWCIYNLPADSGGLPGGVTGEQLGKLGAVTAQNGARRREYYPPCPVNGAHSYAFELFSLRVDCLQPRSNRWPDVRAASIPHLIESVRLTGLYRCAQMSDRQAFWRNMRLMFGG